MSTRIVLFLMCLGLASCAANEQQPLPPRVDGPNVVLITIDGLRWQEVFNGADAWLLGNPDYMHNLAPMNDRFWHNDRVRRRELLMPFLWRKFGAEGQIYGNRSHGCEARVTNNMWFSYPGYNEMLVGYPDDFRIASNSPIDNPNVTVLEYLNRMPEFAGRVVGAAMWDPIGNAVNEKRSGVTIRTSVESLGAFPGAAFPALFSDLEDTGKSMVSEGGLAAGSALSGAPWAHMRDRYLDKVTFQNALDLVDEVRPRVLYLALGAPDEDAHRGNYEGYLLSIRQMDEYLRRLMNKLEAMPEYAGRTSYVVAVDHGRGVRENWTSHGRTTPHSDEIWFALLGPGVAQHGEITRECRVDLAQIASTVADLLGLGYSNEKAVAPPLPYR